MTNNSIDEVKLKSELFNIVNNIFVVLQDSKAEEHAKLLIDNLISVAMMQTVKNERGIVENIQIQLYIFISHLFKQYSNIPDNDKKLILNHASQMLVEIN